MSQNPSRVPLYGPDGRQWGYADWGPNGFILVSIVPDPPEIRLGATHGGGLGKLSWDYVRPDGVHEELGTWQGKLDERYRDAFYASAAGGRPDLTLLAGEVTLHLRKPGPAENDDQRSTRIFELRHAGVVFDVPVRYSLAALPHLRAYGLPKRIALRAVANGRFVCADDGGDSPLIANRGAIGPWELFDIMSVDGE